MIKRRTEQGWITRNSEQGLIKRRTEQGWITTIELNSWITQRLNKVRLQGELNKVIFVKMTKLQSICGVRLG